jgi:Ca-activated chloride channel family protein
MLELAFPWGLLALPLPLLVLWLAPPRREVVQAVRVPFFEATSAGLDKGEGAVVLPRSRWQMLFAWALWALVVLTIARPEWVGDPVERTEAARDVMLGVDISGSMQTRDFVGADGARGSRLDGVKSVLDGFIADRRDDRIGLIVFGSAPYILVPFTRDSAAARSLLATLQPGMAGQNTMLGDAIGLAIRSFEASKVEARILILLSDGSDTGSRMAPAKAADIAARNGVVIHTIAVGDPGAASDSDKVDIAALQAIASATGGSFNRAEDASGLAAIYAEIDAAGARQGQTTSWRPRTPLTFVPAAAFVVLVLLAYVLRLAAARVGRRRHRPVAA